MFMKFENNSDSLRLRSRLRRGEKFKKKSKKNYSPNMHGL